MGSGYKSFTAASVLTSADVNDYLMEQSVMSFATTADRDAALTAPVLQEGMVAVITGSDLVTIYTGSAWVEYGRYGAWESWTPALTAVTTNPTLGNTASLLGSYTRTASVITGWGRIGSFGTGTAAGTGNYLLSLPASMNYPGFLIEIGSAFYLDASGTSRVLSLQAASSTTATMVDGTGTISSTSPGLATNDQIRYSFTYESA
jgi:hypothetical protein